MAKIYSWNVNGVRAACKHGMLEWLSMENPDILCLQETKAQTEDLDPLIVEPFGYHSYWFSAEKKGYSGTAIYSRMKPQSVKSGMGIAEFDSEGRTLIADFGAFTLINCYFPNSRRDHSRLWYKLKFCKSILKLCDDLTSKGKNIVLCGDINVAHKEIDLRNPKTNVDNAGFLPEERAWLDKFLDSGYVDTFREFCKDAGQYTWWSNRPGVREKNVGWRLDYHFINQKFRKRLLGAAIHADVFGSDHCPVSVDLDVTLT